MGSDAAGKMGKCPSCGGQIRIPSMEQIEAARKSKPVELKLEPEEELEEEFVAEEEEEEEEEDASEKPSTKRFKAPARSKTRSKALASLHGEEERRTAETRTHKAEKGKGKKRGKTRTKTRGRGRSKTSVMEKYRKKGGEDEDEGGYVRKKKNPVKMLIIAGIVVIGGLVAAYALHWGPQGKAVKRTRAYVDAMGMFIRDVQDKFLKNYSDKIPASDTTYKRYVEDIKNDAGMVLGAMNKKMENAYQADDFMHQIIRTLEREARPIIHDRMEKDTQGRITNEDLDKLTESFTAKIREVNVKVSDIEKLLDTVRPQVGYRRVLEDIPGR